MTLWGPYIIDAYLASQWAVRCGHSLSRLCRPRMIGNRTRSIAQWNGRRVRAALTHIPFSMTIGAFVFGTIKGCFGWIHSVKSPIYSSKHYSSFADEDGWNRLMPTLREMQPGWPGRDDETGLLPEHLIPERELARIL